MNKKEFNIRMCKNVLSGSLIFIIMAVLLVLPVNAALQSVGPNDPVIGFPIYYKDTSGLTLLPCLDQNGNCVLPLVSETLGPGGTVSYNPALPIVFPSNFPSENFYWVADAFKPPKAGPNGNAKIAFRMSLEGAFATLNPLGAPVDGQQITFLRVNLKKTSGLSPNSVYTVTYPFGTFQFSTDSTGTTVLGIAGQAFRTQDPGVPIQFAFADVLPASTTNIGPFLTAVSPVPPAGYIGNPLVGQTITNGPNGNFLRIDGPNIGGNGINTWSTNQWALAGKIMTPGVTMSVNPATNSVPVNTFANYVLTVTNTGNAPDKISLTIQGPAGATASLSASSVTLLAGASGTVTLGVMSANPGSYVVGVTATSSSNPAVNSVVTTTTTVTGVTPTIAMLKPLGTQQFSIGGATANWASSDTLVGNIDATGLFTAAAPGITTVTATDPVSGAVLGTATVIVGANSTTQPLLAGYNLIYVPFQTDPSFTASKLLQLVAAQNPGVSGLKVVRWNAATQAFETFDPVAGITDFPIALQAYFVKVSANAANGITIVGN